MPQTLPDAVYARFWPNYSGIDTRGDSPNLSARRANRLSSNETTDAHSR
jgi:hypothetical protein